MYTAEAVISWWLIPLLLIGFCFFMCVFRMQRGGMAGCCWGWHRSHGPTDPRGSGREDDVRPSYTGTWSARKAEAEKLKLTFDRLERRLRNLEDAVTCKESDWNRRFHRS